MRTDIYIHRDSFNPNQPRANNGQFGAGEGKSHSEHAAHHKVEYEKHMNARMTEHKAGNSEKAKAQFQAGNHHYFAAGRHKIAAANSAISEQAHAASKKAHEASVATDG